MTSEPWPGARAGRRTTAVRTAEIACRDFAAKQLQVALGPRWEGDRAVADPALHADRRSLPWRAPDRDTDVGRRHVQERGIAAVGMRIESESPSSQAGTRPAAGKPGRWTNPRTCARRGAREANFKRLRSDDGGCRKAPAGGRPSRRIPQSNQCTKGESREHGKLLRRRALPCYRSGPETRPA